MTAIGIWLLVWAIVAVALFVTVDTAQRYIYEERVDLLAWRVVAISPVLAAALVQWPLAFPDMFYDPALWLQVGLWIVACLLCFRFQPIHAVGVGTLSLMLFGPLASYLVLTLASAG